MRPADAYILNGEQAAGFTGFLLAQQGRVIGCGWFERTRQRRRGRKIAVGGQAFLYFGVFEYVQSFTVHKTDLTIRCENREWESDCFSLLSHSACDEYLFIVLFPTPDCVLQPARAVGIW